MRYCIFEDHLYKNFLPLTYTRPVFELRCGVATLREGIERLLPGHRTDLLCRQELADCLQEDYREHGVNLQVEEDTWFVNGRIIAEDRLKKLLRTNPKEDTVYISSQEIAAAFVTANNVQSVGQDLIDSLLTKFSRGEEFECTFVHYPWDVVDGTSLQIGKEFTFLNRKTGKGKLFQKPKRTLKGVHIVNPAQILIGKHSTIKPGVVLDAEKGPIIIGPQVTIMSNAVIEGPAYIGDHSVIKIGAKIYHGTSIGRHCKVGGEVEASVIHSYSNKQHDGFLGHAYLGSWINIGADSNNSDLKNTYGNVKVQIDGKLVDSGKQFVGLIMGDHAKTGINTMFDTGTVVGVSCNIYGSRLPSKFIPSFSWGEHPDLSVYDIEKSIETARRVMARRNVTMAPAYERMMKNIFTQTGEERRRAGVKQRG